MMTANSRSAAGAIQDAAAGAVIGKTGTPAATRIELREAFPAALAAGLEQT
jgi:bifunctional ADP-heptose synthase (sugar kinase/adenylyltransferase)